ncbi:hypothetical protein [Actinospica sp.]|uniref:helix-turn-helix domain-containing protein n=1 Tax=Actinospica sp. TaxID=1872142 RepID=UPI002CE0E735|nr:hypothetical protein [Actinospica sp.]HWG28571.1 hypothetical protein [Actinospica sp.]
MRGYEDFHVAVRTAIERRGLSLDRLRLHMAARDVRISTSTLSNWQRGIGQPRSPESLRALAALEGVLGMPGGALARHIVDRNGADDPPPLGPGMPRGLAARMREKLRAPDASSARVLSVQAEVRIGLSSPFRVLRTRKVVQADRSGLDRHVVLYHSDTSVGRPLIRPLGACRLGRTLRHEDSGLLAAEVLFAPLRRAETFPLEYEISDDHQDPYHGNWFRDTGQRYELTIHLDPELDVRSAHQIRRTEAGLPNRDVRPIRAIGRTVLHLLVPEAAAGFHGVRWE